MTSSKNVSLISLFCLVAASAGLAAKSPQKMPQVEMSLDIALVWSGHPVRFCLLTKDDHQFVAYYDENRRMTVATRNLDSKKWRYQKLDSEVGWDSHNYITMALDAENHIHLCGNMHVDPLVYFRTTKPWDIGTFERILKMVGRLENRCTYPKFFTGADGELIFTYRDGSSGSGNQIYNVYDVETRTWRRLLDTPLIDGEGKMNAYIVGPVRGPDGDFHICWVWRDTPDCCTNHDLSYARSKDLLHWQTSASQAVALPITIYTEGIIVDPVPAKGGMINGNTKIGFDSANRPVISYHKFDENGMTQLYNARLEDGRWKIYQTSDWDYRWYFQGGGTIHFEIRVSPVVPREDGSLTQSYRHDKYGSGTWKLDEDTLRPVGQVRQVSQWPAHLTVPESNFLGMQVRWQADAGESPAADVKYFLRWETVGVNRDRPRRVVPGPSMLRLYEFRYR